MSVYVTGGAGGVNIAQKFSVRQHSNNLSVHKQK